MEELLEFLMDKCSKGLEEAKEKCVDPSLKHELESIQDVLGLPKPENRSTPLKLKDERVMKDKLYDLISTLTDITVSHTHNRPVRIICSPLQIRSRRNTQKRHLGLIKAALQDQLGQGQGPTDGSPDSKEEDGRLGTRFTCWISKILTVPKGTKNNSPNQKGANGAGSAAPGEGTKDPSSNEKKVECSVSETLPEIKLDKILGFDDKREKIEDCLNVRNRGGHIEIGIVGMCGTGKTTLAQLVYERVVGEFKHGIWVNLPHNLKSNDDKYFEQILSEILSEILKQCREDKVDPKNNFKQCGEDKVDPKYNFKQCGEDKVDPAQYKKQQLLRIIRNRLLGKSYLLVLDGVWDADMDWYFELGKALDWHYKDGDFGNDGSKSAVIITTRLEEPAKTMVGISPSALHHIHPEDFSKDTCWSIFINQVKREIGEIEEDNAILLELENDTKLSNDIKEQCDGLPLAAVTLAKITPKLISQQK